MTSHGKYWQKFKEESLEQMAKHIHLGQSRQGGIIYSMSKTMISGCFFLGRLLLGLLMHCRLLYGRIFKL